VPRTFWILAACGSLFVLSNKPFAASLQPVAFAGQQAPGLPIGVTYDRLWGIALNSAGQVAFNAVLEGNGITSANDTSLWSQQGGSLGLVAREGERAPGTPDGVNYANFGSALGSAAPDWNDSGQIAFRARLSGPGISDENDLGIWFGESGSMSLVVRDGNPVPGMPDGFRFLGLIDSFMDSAGNLAIFASAGQGMIGPNGPYTFGVWGGNPHSLAVVAHEGAEAPGMAGGITFDSFYFDPLRFSSGGHVGLQADVTGPGVEGYNRSVIWSGTLDALQFLARTGMDAPGTESGTTFGSFGRHTINANGKTTFDAYLGGPGVTAINRWGLYSDISGSLELVARTGEQAPGTPDGVYFAEDFEAATNAAGHILFWNSLAGPGVVDTSDYINAGGIWSNASGAFSLVTRLGDHMPGTPSGVFLGEFDGATMNELGQAAFTGWLDGPGIDRSRNSGVWAQNRRGVLRLIGRAGDWLEVAPGDTRQIEDIFLTAINDRGQLAIWAGFTDRSQGIFISNMVAIPEPTLPAFMVSALMTLFIRRPTARLDAKVQEVE
jgi:hypothetical protein